MTIRVGKVELFSGDVIDAADGVTAVVGPNNVGKSTLLRQIAHMIGQPGAAGTVVRRIELEYSGSAEKYIEKLSAKVRYRDVPDGQSGVERIFLMNGTSVPANFLRSVWNTQQPWQQYSAAMCLYLDPTSRLDMSQAGPSFDPLRGEPNGPLQRLYASRDLEEHFDGLTRRAFGQRFTVSRYGGNQISLHMGRPVSPEQLPPPGEQYLRELASLPQWQEQGDGMKAFVGILLSVMTAEYPIVVIDEPEAFLHPPQVYLLGRILAEQHASDTQVLIATHSADLIRGLTSIRSKDTDVSVVRLTRAREASNHAAQVPSGAIRSLYEDPLIRYFNILEGFFYSGVILCEADSDCTYYRAVMEATTADGDAAPAVHFAHCGGKARLYKAAEALRRAEVPVVCAVDIDFLQDDQDFARLVRALGGDPDQYRASRNTLISAMRSKGRMPERDYARYHINKVLDGASARELSQKEIKEVRSAVAAQTGWRDFKQAGKSMLQGQEAQAFDHLNRELRALGIFLVECGELERFHADISGNDKAYWLGQVLEQEKYLESAAAREYVMAMVAQLGV